MENELRGGFARSKSDPPPRWNRSRIFIRSRLCGARSSALVDNGVVPAKKAAFAPAYQLKIELLGITPPIWRRLQVPGNIKLSRLHDVIQAAMGWTDSHLHQFEMDGKYWGNPEYYEDDDIEVIDERRVVLYKLLQAEGDSVVYTYDFGDNWRHTVLVEQILGEETVVLQPVCLAGERHCPPEDVGGTTGYQNFLDVIFDPTHKEHEHYVTWVGGRFQPEEFNVGTVNRSLAKSRRRSTTSG